MKRLLRKFAILMIFRKISIFLRVWNTSTANISLYRVLP